MNEHEVHVDDQSEDYTVYDALSKACWDERSLSRKLLIDDDISPKVSKCLRPEIADSWIRCKTMGVDPHAAKLASAISDEDYQTILDIYTDLIDAAKPLMEMAGSLSLANEYIFELLSRNDVTLLRTGNLSLHDIVESQSMMNESTMGTNAHTLCMKYAESYIVVGNEHYCDALNNLAGIACPIFDQNNVVMASLLLTQPLPEDPWSKEYETDLSHALDFVRTLAVSLEQKTDYKYQLSELMKITEEAVSSTKDGNVAQQMLNMTIQSSDDPVLILNASGIVQYASPEAIHILKSTSESIVGFNIEDVIELSWPHSFIPLIGNPGASIIAERGTLQYEIKGNAVRNSDDDSLDGFVIHISLVKDSKPKSLAKSGEEASVTFTDILGSSVAIRETISIAKRYAMTSENVLLIGESGTGKEYFAQAIHNLSRASGPFMSVNCAAIPERLIESELFGYESGAFTGADKAGKPGKIELADGGTLFLDEIGDMPLELQATLLRVLENKRVMRIGGKSYKPVDFRVIAATNKSLSKMAEEGTFREDLFYRLSILSISIPPLRMRNGDVMFFAYYYLNDCRRKAHDGPIRFSPEVEQLISDFSWPGNVRQIKNAVYSSFYAAVGEEIGVDDLPRYIRDGVNMMFGEGFEDAKEEIIERVNTESQNETKEYSHIENIDYQIDTNERSYDDSETGIPSIHDEEFQNHTIQDSDELIKIPNDMLNMSAIEESTIRLAMIYAEGNVAKASEYLNISKATLYRKLKEYGLK